METSTKIKTWSINTIRNSERRTEYSTPWKKVNTKANTIVTAVPYKAPFLLPCIKEWWAYVIVTPEDNNNIVFNKGNSNGFTACIPKGGHCAPNSTLGDNSTVEKCSEYS